MKKKKKVSASRSIYAKVLEWKIHHPKVLPNRKVKPKRQKNKENMDIENGTDS